MRATIVLIIVVTASTSAAAAQAPPSAPLEIFEQAAQPPTREAAIAQDQAAKAKDLHPYKPGKDERIFQRVDTILAGGRLRWHPFFDSAYAGGGFTLGAGHVNYVSAYNYIDARASYSIANYKRAEVEFIAPRMFKRRAQLSVLGGWREAPQVGFFGIGNDTTEEDRTNYLFRQPYGSALFTIFPARRFLALQGGFEYSRWSLDSGKGSFPSVETKYTAAELPGLGAEVTYLHSQVMVGLDWRTSPGYSRRGGFYGVTVHQYSDPDNEFGFHGVEYEAIQHIPILRETWVLSLHGRVQASIDNVGEQTPFFLLPSLGGGSSLRGYSSRRFHDRNTMLLQAEWRVMVNRYLDLALFYDTGKVAASRKDLDFDGLKDDYGVGVRFHGPFATPLRIELARSREGMMLVFTSSPVF